MSPGNAENSTEVMFFEGWLRTLLWVIGATSILNGLAMYTVPNDWFVTVPGVVDTGPFNGHFVRDVGAAYMAMGAAVILAIRVPQARLPLLLVASIFAGGHALRHVVEWGTVEGAHHNWIADATAVVLPAIIVLIATAILWRDRNVTNQNQ